MKMKISLQFFCFQECQLPCSESIYQKTVSTVPWPSEGPYADEQVQNFNQWSIKKSQNRWTVKKYNLTDFKDNIARYVVTVLCQHHVLPLKQERIHWA
jgi:hypothetical protein